jgi:hypothetical protein
LGESSEPCIISQFYHNLLAILVRRKLGITNATDGSEDGQIHCFKENGPTPTGFVRLQQARSDQMLAEMLEKIDLGQDEKNGYASDGSIDLNE